MPRGVYERKPKTKTTEDTVAEDQKTNETPDVTPDVDPDVTPGAPDDQRPAEGELCGQCWPAGWPENGDAASCVHGEWQR